MANEITSSTTSNDQEKFLASKLVSRASLKLVAAALCDKHEQPKGTGTTAYFIRYNRMNLPTSTLTEAGSLPPSNSTFTLTQYTVTLDQWGDVITLTDVAMLTTKHPLLQQALELLADNAARVIDREIQIVWVAGTNVQYGDASVTTRRTVTTAMIASSTVIHKARVTMIDNGAPPRDGPSFKDAKQSSAEGGVFAGSHYVGVCGPQVMADIMAAGTSLGTWASVAMYSNQKALYNAEVGTWLGIRWVETNFIAKFAILGNTTAAVSSGGSGGITGLVVTAVDGGGSLKSATTFYWKVTRKSLTRGFEEDISIAHSTASAATGDNESFTFALPSTAGYVYNVYFDTVTTGGTGTDATLGLVSANNAASATVTVTTNPAATTNPPDNVNTTGTPTIHPVYIHAAESCRLVTLANLETYITPDEASVYDPLKQQRKLGYKFFQKAMLADQQRLLRVELASTY